MTQLVEHVPSKHKALCSNPSTTYPQNIYIYNAFKLVMMAYACN
jgi:hypothetical protein